MRNYKGTDSKMRCQGFQFELGKRHSIPDDVKLELCYIGFHSCDTLWNVSTYYGVANSRYFEVEIEDTLKGEDKNVSRHITFIRELTFYEVMRMLNRNEDRSSFTPEQENTNTGFYNTGNNNTGNNNTGNANNGNYNIGNYNNGNYNTGNYNYGLANYGKS